MKFNMSSAILVATLLLTVGLCAQDTEKPFISGQAQPTYPILAVDPPDLTAVTAPQIMNAVLLEDLGKSGRTPSRRPISISRMFARGEFQDSVQAVVAGMPVPTQCDVKTRWPDQSVRHAILSFWVDIGDKQNLQVDFVSATGVDPGSPLSKDEMLAFLDGKWDVSLNATPLGEQGSALSQLVTAKSILANWDSTETYSGVRYWLKGAIATQVIVEDRSGATPFDFGWELSRPTTTLATAVSANGNSLAFKDISAFSQITFPVTLIVDQESMAICSIDGNIGSVCPNGRGLFNTAKQNHGAGAVTLIAKGWTVSQNLQTKSIHPIFVLTFYPGWAGVKADVIVENAWMDRMQDQYYSAQVFLGGDSPTLLWESPLVRHYYGSRWRRVGWIGDAPGKVRVDHNFPYLVYSRAVPSYDLALRIDAGSVAASISDFQKSDRGEPNGHALWNVYFPSTGGRPDIGLLPKWYVQLLYSWDAKLYDVVQDLGSVSANMPMHYREPSSSSRVFDPYSGSAAASRVLSIDARPTTFIYSPLFERSEIAPEERTHPVGSLLPSGWSIDDAHQPSIVFLPYLLSGDWFYLEEMQFWSAYNLGMGNPGRCDYCRIGSLGYLNSQVRGQAWRLRTLADTVVMTPDGDAEKTYFLSKLQNNIALREGLFAVTDGLFYLPAADCKQPCSLSRWRLGKDVLSLNKANPLRFLEYGNFTLVDPTTIDTSKVKAAGSPWMWNFMHIVLGRIEEEGFGEVRALRKALGANLIQQLLDPSYNPYLAKEYRTPTGDADGNYFTTWASVKDAYNQSYQSINAFTQTDLSCQYCYPHILRGAAAWLVGLDDGGGLSGQSAFGWIDGKLGGTSQLGKDPTWAFAPRISSISLASRTAASKWRRLPAKNAKHATKSAKKDW